MQLNYFSKLVLIGAILFAVAISCDDDNPVGNGNDNGNNVEFIELTGDLSTQRLTADKKYLLLGQVFVRNGQVLNIDPGTVIFGDKRTRGTLIIDVGGKIIADGTRENPIVFTSAQEPGVRDRGDWGGLVILGRANTNQPNPAIEGITPEVNFGTYQSSQYDDESSGILRFVRVEFGGIELSPNNETNSITMGGVGRGTLMEYNMVSFGGDDGFEWFGGTVNGKYFVSHAMWDDDFDCDYGWSGNVQFGLAIRYPGFADQSGSNGIECDNGPNDTDVTPYTTATFSNMTIIGPVREGTSVSNNNYSHAVDLRRRVSISIFNSVFTGFTNGIRFNQPSVYANYNEGRGFIENNVFVGLNGSTFRAGTGVDASDVADYLLTANSYVEGPFSDQLHQDLGINPDVFFGERLASQYPSSPNYAITSGTLATGADFSHTIFSETNRDDFFDEVNFVGAFGADNWAAGWTEFDPVDKVY